MAANTMSDRQMVGQQHNFVNIGHVPRQGSASINMSRRSSCRSGKERKHSLLFHRASPFWWIPKFDSDILEGQYWRSTFPQIRLRFQLALLYVFIVSLSWCVYFSAVTIHHWLAFAGSCLVMLFLSALAFCLTLTPIYQHHHLLFSGLMAASICLVTLPAHLTCRNGTVIEGEVSPAGLLALSMEALLLIYTVIPLPMYMCVGIGLLYSLAVESLSIFLACCETNATSALVRALLHLGVHLIGIHIFIMTQVRMRCTFLKVGQLLLVRRELELEAKLKEKMIHFLMPPRVAIWLLNEGHDSEDNEEDDSQLGEEERERPIPHPRGHKPSFSNVGKLFSIFRPFNMNRMENVSILFADIVGFTQMSSNKTAEQLVGLLNDLFGRFDQLCQQRGCEKISTLGDCYYCVSGCPEPRPDHANCCVEMGLSMIEAIGLFDAERGENVSMRVGVHTGTVLCGIVGTKRFKFDVWSNDVTLANQMESTGKPSQVHVTHSTFILLDDMYRVEEGSVYHGLKTYFVLGRKSDLNAEDTTTAELTSLWLDEAVHIDSDDTTQQLSNDSLVKNCNSNSSKKACSMPSILDEVAHSTGDNNGNLQENAPLRTTRSVSQDRRKRQLYYNQQRSHQDELSPLSSTTGTIAQTGVDMCSSNAIVCPAGQNGRTDDLSLFPSVESFIKAQGASASNTLPRKNNNNTTTIAMQQQQQQQQQHHQQQQPNFAPSPVVTIATERMERSPTYVSLPLNNKGEIEQPFEPMDGSTVVETSVVLHASLSRFHQLRKQSDLQMIRCIQEDKSHRVYFKRPPLRQITLFFIDEAMEKEYRARAHSPDQPGTPLTLASPTYNTYLDILVSAVVFVLISIACFVHFEWSWTWGLVFVWGTFILIATSAVFLHNLCREDAVGQNFFTIVHNWCTRWYSWHFCGALLMSLPVMAVMSNFGCRVVEEKEESSRIFWYLFFFSLVHFCNFTQLNCWMKNALAALATLCLILLVSTPICSCDSISLSANATSSWNGPLSEGTEYEKTQLALCYEIILHLLLLLLLVCFLNREFEISFRLSFHCNTVAARGKAKVQSLKDQADWLLHNIIPRHVLDQMKTRPGYSENHRQAGILFASLVNFNEMYDESYLGGREYLRVLNELISDFDELLEQPQFKNVDKIKTIGSTFMAASGLNSEVRARNSHPNQHLFELIEFALQLQNVLQNFNQNLLEFNLIIRVGYNCGDVTAGVIGTTKLYYDIWGDAVNIASRMDSTGVHGRVQTTEACVQVLEERYEFEKRGTVYVKGKNDMNVYLLGNKK